MPENDACGVKWDPGRYYFEAKVLAWEQEETVRDMLRATTMSRTNDKGIMLGTSDEAEMAERKRVVGKLIYSQNQRKGQMKRGKEELKILREKSRQERTQREMTRMPEKGGPIWSRG